MNTRKTDVVTAAELRAVVLAEVEVEEDVIRAAEVEHRAALADLDREATEIRAAHDRAAALARAEYAAIPPLPELPDGQPHREALHELMRARDALGPRRTEALATALPAIVRAWDAARAPLDDQAREIAGEAAALAEEFATWHRLLRDARKAAEQPTSTRGRIRNGPSERMRPRPTSGDVLAAAAGVDLCGAGPTDADVRVQLVTGRLDDGSGRVVVGG